MPINVKAIKGALASALNPTSSPKVAKKKLADAGPCCDNCGNTDRFSVVWDVVKCAACDCEIDTTVKTAWDYKDTPNGEVVGGSIGLLFPSSFNKSKNSLEIRAHGGGKNYEDVGLTGYGIVPTGNALEEFFQRGSNRRLMVAKNKNGSGEFVCDYSSLTDNPVTQALEEQDSILGQLKDGGKNIDEVISYACNNFGGTPEFYEKILKHDLKKVTMTPEGNYGLPTAGISAIPARILKFFGMPVAPLRTYMKEGGKWVDKGDYETALDSKIHGVLHSIKSLFTGTDKTAYVASELRAAEKATNTNPSEAQKESGNYKKGRFDWHGLSIAIENPEGSIRKGVDKSGTAWSIKMRSSYGYITNAGDSKADGDKVDVFIGNYPENQLVGIIDQFKGDTFDEHKCVLGVKDAEDAEETYLSNYPAGWKGCGGVTLLTLDQFKSWLKRGDTGEPLKGQAFKEFHKHASDDASQYLLSYVPTTAVDAILQNGLLSGDELAKPENRHLLELARTKAEGDSADAWLERKAQREKETPWSLAYKGPSVLFGEADPDKIHDKHPTRRFSTVPIRINLQKLLEKYPDTKLHGTELVPFDESWDTMTEEQKDQHAEARHHDLSPEEIVALFTRAQNPKDMWQHYNDPEGKTYAGGVPHMQIITPNGKIDPEFLELIAAHKTASTANEVMYHGAPESHDELEPRITRVTGEDPRVFATPNLGVALSFLSKWNDEDFAQGSINGKLYMRELAPGNFKRIFGGKSGYIHSLPSDTFEKDGRLTRYERVSRTSVKPHAIELIEDALEALQAQKEMELQYAEETEKTAAGLFSPTTPTEAPPAPTTGAAAIVHRLRNLDVASLEKQAREDLKSGKKTRRPDAVNILNILEGLKRNQMNPGHLTLTKIPVVPPLFRPYAVAGDTFIPGNENELYRDLMHAKKQRKELAQVFGEENSHTANNTVYHSVKALMGYGDPVNAETKARGVTGFFKRITGSGPKQSWLMSKMIAKPVDTVGRSVVSVNPDLNIDQIGMPEDMAWRQFQPHLVRTMVQRGIKQSNAIVAVKNRDDLAKKTLERLMTTHPVVYSRAPSWHKFNVVSGYAKIVEGDALQVNPYIAVGAGLDHDGDTINIHVPATYDAIEEANTRLKPSNMVFKIRNPESVMSNLKHEQILGLMGAQHAPAKQRHQFASEEEATAAINSGKVPLHDEVEWPDPIEENDSMGLAKTI